MNTRQLFPCGLNRREALWQMGGGFTGIALTAMLEEQGFFRKHLQAAEPTPQVASPHFAPKARAVIHLMMNGAPSQVDTFDPKPLLLKYAGKALPQDKNTSTPAGARWGF